MGGNEKEESRVTPRFLAWEMRRIMSPFTETGTSGDSAGSGRGRDWFSFGYVRFEVPVTDLDRDPTGS